MALDCSKAVPHLCQGNCCRYVPLPKDLVKNNWHLKQREVYALYLHSENEVMAITEDLRCLFLDKDYRCVVYKDRPYVCRVYGCGGADCLSCPYLNPDGSMREAKDSKRLADGNEKNLDKIVTNINRYLKLKDEGKTDEEILAIMGPADKPMTKREALKVIKAIKENYEPAKS